MYLVGFPLLVIPFAIYNIVEFLMPGATPGALWTDARDAHPAARRARNGR